MVYLNNHGTTLLKKKFEYDFIRLSLDGFLGGFYFYIQYLGFFKTSLSFSTFHAINSGH